MAVNDFCDCIETLPPEALKERAWGFKEVLAHILFWHESVTTAAEALINQQPFEVPDGRFDELNARRSNQPRRARRCTAAPPEGGE
ncbi:MAG: ClbS/DfsB family four-helix bundle protein [Chloroflexota bacterium]|nr:ClbS/DfsB family four-helix bundle protein [Chloroflexota bacterium]